MSYLELARFPYIVFPSGLEDCFTVVLWSWMCQDSSFDWMYGLMMLYEWMCIGTWDGWMMDMWIC